MKKAILFSALTLAVFVGLIQFMPPASDAAPGNNFNNLGAIQARSVALQPVNTNDNNGNPLTILDNYGNNLLQLFRPNTGSNYWGFHLGEFTPGKENPINISDIILKTGGNSIFVVAFGATTNEFGCNTGSAEMGWGDINGAGNVNRLFDRQARFFPQHIEPQMVNNASSPSIVIGAAAGTGGSVGVTIIDNSLWATDASVKIQLITGNASLAAGTLFTVTFQLAYANAPKVVFSPRNAATAPEIAKMYVGSTTTTTFVMSATAALTVNTTYLWDFIIVQ